MTIRVTQAGDFELYTVSGTLADGFQFTLPLKARPMSVENTGDTIWFVHKAMSLAASQYNAITPILNAWNFGPGDGRGWWFKDESFRKFAVKARGMNPEYVIVWPNTPPMTLRPDEQSPDHLAVEPEPGFSSGEITFLKSLIYTIPEVPWETLKLLWLATRTEAIRRIAAERRPLDLGFVRLIPVPYRQNWKEALAVRFNSLLSMFDKSAEERHAAFTVSGFYAALASPKMLAIDRGKNFVHWTLECIPSPELQRKIQEHEYARKQKIGPALYTSNLLRELSSHLSATLEIMKWYASRVFIPPASVRNGAQRGSVNLAPAVALGRVRPGRGICDTLSLAPEDVFSEFRDEDFLRKTPKKKIRSDDETLEEDAPMPNMRRLIGAMLPVAISPNPVRGNGRGPSTVSSEEQKKSEPPSNTCSQGPETVLDPPPAEQPGCIDVGPG